MTKRKLTPGPTCLGVVKHPAIGTRVPELFLTGILAGFKERNVAGGLMLSFGRETAPERIIKAKPGRWEITRGHTGTSIKQYMTQDSKAAEKAGVAVEIEADHLIIIGSATAAVQRIAGYHAESHISPEELKKSLEYNKQAIDEAAKVGVVGCFTTDTSDLFWLQADRISPAQVRKLFAERFAPAEGKKLLKRYAESASVARTFRFPAPGGKQVNVSIGELAAMRLALKFQESLKINAEIYNYCQEKLGEKPFSFEISLDETADLTAPKETLFYLTEWKALKLPCHYFAPNVGFGKRADFAGDMKAFETRVRGHHAISRGIARALLSIHSGSGTTPYSGKGAGTYEAITAATGGDVKYKISGVYFELLMELLAAMPTRSGGRKLFEQIFDDVYKLMKSEVKTGGGLAQPLLIDQLKKYDAQVKADPKARRNPRADWFRFQSFLALNRRDESGKRYLRDALIEYAKQDPQFGARLDEEVKALTLRLIDGLNYANNM